MSRDSTNNNDNDNDDNNDDNNNNNDDNKKKNVESSGSNGCSSSSDSDHSVKLQNGRITVHLHPDPQSLAQNTTGWVTWNATVSVLAYLEEHVHDLVRNANVGDLSTGNGLIALATAYMGARHVVATEVPTCLPLTMANVCANPTIQDRIQVLSYKWGQQGEGECPIRNCRLVVGCDLLFIAIRDGLCDELRQCLVELCQNNNQVLFAFEERVVDQEQAFMESLEQRLHVHRVPDEQVVTKDLSNAEGENDMFYEAPSVRLYLLTNTTTTTTY